MSYDQIAPVYDADMGASMLLPDVEFYLDAARIAGGPVLELGCGSGRVLGALRAAGVAAVGIDRSRPMLQQARVRCGADTPLLQMDLRTLALRSEFAMALLPYSLITYVLDEREWHALAEGLRLALRPGAQILVDAFIPRPEIVGCGWTPDYSRRQRDQWLVRHKRVQGQSDGTHIIERRYRLRGEFGGRTLHTREQIRPYAPEQLIEHCERHFGAIRAIHWDYGLLRDCSTSRFCTLTVQLRPA